MDSCRVDHQQERSFEDAVQSAFVPNAPASRFLKYAGAATYTLFIVLQL